jgi:hypothetical protein
MLDLLKLLQREGEESPVTETGASGHSVDEIAQEYASLIKEQLVRGGVAISCVDIDVRQAGESRDGRHIFVGMLRLTNWERTSAIRLLLGLPILESRLRRAVRGSWMRDLSHFGGVWLHASGQLQDTHAMEDLRAIVVDIERKDNEAAPSDGSVWSVPTTDLGGLHE